MASPNRTVVRCCESGTMAGDCRWLLEVELTDTSGPPLVVVQMNPSTANNSKSDPTVGKVESWARKNGFGGVLFLNLFAIRTPHQSELADWAAGSYKKAVGQDDRWILESAARAAKLGGAIVAAWGRPDVSILPWVCRRESEVVELVGQGQMQVVGSLTGGRWPRHGRGWNHSPNLSPWNAGH